MDAIDYLTDQHHEILSLFDQIESASRTEIRLRLCRKLFDLLAVHAAIEEMIFYPAAQASAADELLTRAFEEHLSVERVVADIMELDWASDGAAEKLSALKARKLRHVAGEEAALFPRVREMVSSGQLEALAARMANVADQLMGPGVGVRERLAAQRALA
jgi:hemerythrin-like domain-containing protein